MKFRKAITFFASVAVFIASTSASVAATSSLLRGGEDIHHQNDRILTSEQPGTFLIANIDYLGDANGRPQETFNIMLDDSSIYEMEGASVDWTNNEVKSWKSGQTIVLPAGVEFKSNGKVNMHGLKPAKDNSNGNGNGNGNKNGFFKRNLKTRTEEQQRDLNQLHRQLYSTTTGTKKVVAVRVVANGGQYSNSEDYLRNKVFGTNGDIFNLKTGYAQCSYNQLIMDPLPSRVGNGATITNGVVTITVDNSVSDGEAAIRGAVTAKIKEQFGVSDITTIADYFLYCIPSAAWNGGIAYAYIDSYISVYNNEWCDHPSSLMHELGHNLNFAHSNEAGASYEDQTGMMGYSYSDDEGPIMCFNAAKSWQSGWYASKSLTMTSGSQCTTTRLSGVADYGSTLNSVLIRIKNPDNTGNDLFVAFNAQKGINVGTQEAGNQVTVVQAGSGGEGYSESNLLQKMSAGASYINSAFGGSKVTIKVVSISGNNYADVQIFFGNQCITSTGPPTQSPPPPTSKPTTRPPTAKPTTRPPTAKPTTRPPTAKPTTRPPTAKPTTATPTTATPTTRPPPTGKPTTLPPTPKPTTLPPTPKPTTLPPTPEPTTLPPTPKPTTLSPTPVPSRNPTPVPTNLDTAQPQDALFDPQYGAPRCALPGSACNSRDLLVGKGTMSGQSESNLPNTNTMGNACVDGNSGTYQSDESIEQIIVTAGEIDGTGATDFITSGGRGTVSVKVWCWSTGSSDYADIYLTNDPSSPNWSHLTTITCPGGGAQWLKHSFDVPQGTSQSIRVNFRYDGSQSTCSNGGYDDHDDLIFTVKQSGISTPSPTSVPTPMPTNESPSGPQSASFDQALGIPKCSVGSSCNSGLLLDGRGIKGPEPNYPNTLNAACIDGGNGKYHVDESVDKIVVSRASGGDGDLTAGEVAIITSTLWCWNDGSSDYVDFYYANDAANPVWNFIERKQCPGGGQQTVTTSYTLPPGLVQAVRVNLMYGAGAANSDSCVASSWDDIDDMAFTVSSTTAGSAAATTTNANKNDNVQGAVADEPPRGDAAIEKDNMKKELMEMNKSKTKPKLKGNNGGNAGNGNGNGGNGQQRIFT